MFIKLFHLRKCGSEPVMWFFPLFTLWWLLRRKSTNYKHQKHCQPARELQGMKSFNIENKKKLPSNPPIKTANAFLRYNKLRVIVTDSSERLCIAIEWNPHTAETIKNFDWMHGASRAEAAGRGRSPGAWQGRARSPTLTRPRTGWPTQGSLHAVWLRTPTVRIGSGAVTRPISKMSRPDARPGRALSDTTHGLHHFLSDSVFSIVNSHLCAIRRARSHLFHVCACAPLCAHIGICLSAT